MIIHVHVEKIGTTLEVGFFAGMPPERGESICFEGEWYHVVERIFVASDGCDSNCHLILRSIDGARFCRFMPLKTNSTETNPE